ncbi:MAG: ABC transporter substrate-binding protein [Lachnospiraceae bacterium]|nr:ABC transporter substrate-binding protein [Lachnospiraceae bacterium]
MKKIKQIIAGLMTLSLILAIGCGKQGNSPASSVKSAAEAETSARQSKIVVGFSQVGSESDWRRANTASYKKVFTDENGFYLIYEDAQQKQENQLKAVRNFILQGVDYIILDPIVETGWEEVLKEAKKANIPVILVDRKADVAPDLYTCWIGSDFYKEGVNAGKWLENYLVKIGKDKENLNIVSLQGTLGSTAQIGRTAGFDDILKEHKNWHMLERQTADFTQAKGKEVMSEFLQKYPEIDILISENDNMSFGAVEAIKAKGMTCGPNGDVMIISYDGDIAALNKLLYGDFNAIFECNSQLGPVVAEVIKKLNAGASVDKTIYVEETYFDDTMELSKIIQERKKILSN